MAGRRTIFRSQLSVKLNALPLVGLAMTCRPAYVPQGEGSRVMVPECGSIRVLLSSFDGGSDGGVDVAAVAVAVVGGGVLGDGVAAVVLDVLLVMGT